MERPQPIVHAFYTTHTRRYITSRKLNQVKVGIKMADNVDTYQEICPGRLVGRNSTTPTYSIKAESIRPLLERDFWSLEERERLIIERANYATQWSLTTPIRCFDWDKYCARRRLAINHKRWTGTGDAVPMPSRKLSSLILTKTNTASEVEQRLLTNPQATLRPLPNLSGCRHPRRLLPAPPRVRAAQPQLRRLLPKRSAEIRKDQNLPPARKLSQAHSSRLRRRAGQENRRPQPGHLCARHYGVEVGSV